MEHLFPYPKMGYSWLEILQDSLTRKLLGFDAVHAEKTPFTSGVSSRLTFLLNDPTRHLSFLKIGYTALEAFLQANCTGPPLDFNPEDSIFPEAYRDEIPSLKTKLLQSLTVDGNAVYPLTPHIELFWLAKLIMSNSTLAEAGFNGRRARFRVDFWHQKLLSERSEALHAKLYRDVEILEGQLASRLTFGGAAAEEHFVEFLMERAAIRIYYGDDDKARDDLAKAAKTRHFQFALTGVLGKRTKFQQDDISQLVVLAKSRDVEPEPYSSRKSSRTEGMESRKGSGTDSPAPNSRTASHPGQVPARPLTPNSQKPGDHEHHASTLSTALLSARPRSHEHEHHISPLAGTPIQPQNIPLNNDTLLERIHFRNTPAYQPELTTVVDSSALPPRLAELDPANQPLLFPMDSIILLSTASSVVNKSPTDGLTREETLPYATRVLEGGSSNWQVYTQALLVRSRIEGYRSRTAERGLLQLQALVDQVIAETSSVEPSSSQDVKTASEEATAATTFLPKPKSSDSASVAERLKYIYQLSPSLRWELEAELAKRWTSMGGLKSALEIYERLHMHAEVALCLAATDREAEAIKLVKGLLFTNNTTTDEDEATSRLSDQGEVNSTDSKTLKLQSPPPADAPRLLCILGDITSTPSYYTLAWTVSSSRYGRAQRSLGRHYIKKRDFTSAADAYRLALERAPLDQGTWFALGCVQLELKDWVAATESFTRCVQLEDEDAQAWSNLAVALLKLPPPAGSVAEQSLLTSSVPKGNGEVEEEEDESIDPISRGDDPNASKAVSPYKHTYEALRALRRAATLRRDDARIWDNYLTVAASIPPNAGTPWSEIIQAMGRVIELRGEKEGESCVDVKILEVLVDHVTSNYEYPIGKDENDETKETPSTTNGNTNPKTSTSKQSPAPDHSPKPTSHPTSQPQPQSKSNQTLAFLPRALLSLIDNQISPLTTTSAPLYHLLSRVSLWRRRPAESLAYTEKAWRAATSVPDVYESEKGWTQVVNATSTLTKAYQTLGEKERERTGGLVEKGWKAKGRSAVRAVLGRGKGNWEGNEGWRRLEKLKGELDR